MTSLIFDPNAPKRPTNLTLNRDLVAKARALGGSLSERVEHLLARDIEEEIRRRADARLDAAVDSSNAFVARYGSFADDFNEGFVDAERGG